MAFMYIKVPSDDQATWQQTQWHQAIDAALQPASLGSLLGWGASLGEADALGRREAAFHRMDLDVSDPQQACAVLQQVMATWPVPPGTEIHHVAAGLHLHWDGQAWQPL